MISPNDHVEKQHDEAGDQNGVDAHCNSLERSGSEAAFLSAGFSISSEPRPLQFAFVPRERLLMIESVEVREIAFGLSVPRASLARG